MKQAKNFRSHVKKHHKNYILGILTSILAVKLYMLFFAGVGVVQYGMHHETRADVNTGVIETNTGEIYTGELYTGDLLTGEIYTGDVLTGEVYTGTVESNTGEIYTGDILTGEISTGTIEVMTGDVENNTGDIFSGELYTGEIIENNTGALYTGDIVEEIVRDTNIEEISFNDILDAERAIGYFSNVVVITGINTGVDLIPHNLLYLVNTGELSSDSSVVYQDDIVQVYMVSRNNYEAVQEGYIEVGTGQYGFAIGTMEEIVEEEIVQETGTIDTGNYAMFTENAEEEEEEEEEEEIVVDSGVVITGIITTGVVETGIIVENIAGSGLLQIFKQELYKYQVCKEEVNIKEVAVSVDGDTYELLLPDFESKFLGNISALFSNLIVQTLNDKDLAEDEIDEVLHNFNNFLVVLKLLRDGDAVDENGDVNESCQHSLSNYYINKFQNSLGEYRIFGGEK